MKFHLLASISLLSIACAATLPAAAATPPGGAAPTAQKPKPIQTPKTPASTNKARVAPGKTLGVAVGDINGDGRVDATSRTAPPGGAREKPFTNPDCGTYCQCGGGCNAVDPKKPVQNAGGGGAATPNEGMSLNFEEVKATVKAGNTNAAQMGSQSSSPTNTNGK